MELSRPVSMEIQGGVNSKRPIFMGDRYHSKLYSKCEAPAQVLSYDEKISLQSLQTTSDAASPYLMTPNWNQNVTRDRSSASSIYSFLLYQGIHGAHQIRQNKLQPRDSTDALKIWLSKHKKNPYPSKGEKIMLAILSNMTLTQVSTWFANARRRLKKDYSSDIHRFGPETEISIQARSEVAGIIPLVPEKIQYFTSLQER